MPLSRSAAFRSIGVEYSHLKSYLWRCGRHGRVGTWRWNMFSLREYPWKTDICQNHTFVSAFSIAQHTTFEVNSRLCTHAPVLGMLTWGHFVARCFFLFSVARERSSLGLYLSASSSAMASPQCTLLLCISPAIAFWPGIGHCNWEWHHPKNNNVEAPYSSICGITSRESNGRRVGECSTKVLYGCL